MRQRIPYKVYPILLKTHKTTIFLEAPASKTISSLKEDALSALTSRVIEGDNFSRIQNVTDFEICRERKEQGKALKYELLDGKELVQKVTVAWESLYIRFKDNDGRLLPVQVTIPSIVDEDEDEIPNRGRDRMTH